VIDLDGPPCGCGGHGHLESYASGRAADGVARAIPRGGRASRWA
jgi:predicted NBD/HSP70 family sugar kinase